MIHYHGTPITPEHVAARILSGRHAFISFTYPEQLPLASTICQSFALDNGAFSAWRSGGVDSGLVEIGYSKGFLPVAP
jgi:hypothetical protein